MAYTIMSLLLHCMNLHLLLLRIYAGNLSKNAEFFYALFSESGFEEKLAREADTSTLQLFSLDRIVKG